LDECINCRKNIFKGSNTLFIIDDCTKLEDVKKIATSLTNLAFSADITELVFGLSAKSIILSSKQKGYIRTRKAQK